MRVGRHPERSEGSESIGRQRVREILRYAQDDDRLRV